MATAASNPLKDLLAAGLSKGSEFALGKLFESTPATETTKQAEIIQVGQSNGTGPVNAKAAMESPKSWTEQLFGVKKVSSAATGEKPVGMSTLYKVLVAAAVVGLAWFIWKKA